MVKSVIISALPFTRSFIWEHVGFLYTITW